MVIQRLQCLRAHQGHRDIAYSLRHLFYLRKNCVFKQASCRKVHRPTHIKITQEDLLWQDFEDLRDRKTMKIKYVLNHFNIINTEAKAQQKDKSWDRRDRC